MPENTIVVRPSENHPELDQYHKIIENGVAKGFSASYKRVKKMDFLIITDGYKEATLTDIKDVEFVEPRGIGGQRRVNITFDNVREPKNLFEKIHRGENNPNGIKWSSKNIRYIELPSLD